MRQLLERLCLRKDLSLEESRGCFTRLVRGEFSEIEISALLAALTSKGETPEEIAGAAAALRQSALAIDTAGLVLADSCGTGGDGAATVNISTAVALVCAEAGLAMAKHGNRSVSSRSGSADVLENCGIRIEESPEFALRTLREIGICFLFAPLYHPGMRYAMPVRKKLGIRTIFNIIGPLANPAKPRYQLVGVYRPDLCAPMARTLGLLGCSRALVVHGSGLDEIALHGTTSAALWQAGGVQELLIQPEDLGLVRSPVEALRGGSPAENAAWLQTLLAGRGSEVHQQAVALNAGALLWVAGAAADLRQGFQRALQVIRSGRAAGRLQRWAELSHGA